MDWTHTEKELLAACAPRFPTTAIRVYHGRVAPTVVTPHVLQYWSGEPRLYGRHQWTAVFDPRGLRGCVLRPWCNLVGDRPVLDAQAEGWDFAVLADVARELHSTLVLLSGRACAAMGAVSALEEPL